MNRRVLMVAYNYGEEGMGAMRLRRVARRLPGLGWEPVVLVHPREPGAADQDPGVRLEEVAALDLTKLYRKLLGGGNPGAPSTQAPQPVAQKTGLTSQLNRWVMIPDKQMTWYRPALRRGRELLAREKFDLIFSSVEPRTTALVASQLAAETGIPSVMEFRDLWVGNPYYHITQPTWLHRRLHQHLEGRAVQRTRRLSAVCRGIAQSLTERHGAVLSQPVGLNYNFFVPEEYPAANGARPTERPFTISYTGALYATRRPDQFFEGMRRFIDQTRLTPDQFRFRWAGRIAVLEGLEEILERTGVRPHLDFLGQIPHRQALRMLIESDAAVVIQAPDDTIHIPGKLFEALGARVPVLLLANPCETAQIVEHCHAGIICPHTAPSVAAALTEFRRLALQNQRWSFAETEVQRFSADSAVAALAALFHEAAS